MSDWRNRHVSRVVKPKGVPWAEMTPVCPLCGYECMAALCPADFLYILEDHYTVCRRIPAMSSEVVTWHFGARSHLRFKWDPLNSYAFWVYLPHEGTVVRIFGMAVFPKDKTLPLRVPTQQEAQDASRKFVLAWEETAKELGLSDDLTNPRIQWWVSAKYYGDRHVIKPMDKPWPDEYYVHKRREDPDLTNGRTVVAAMLNVSDEQAEEIFRRYWPAVTLDQALVDIAVAQSAGTLVRDVPITDSEFSDPALESSGKVDREVLGLFE